MEFNSALRFFVPIFCYRHHFRFFFGRTLRFHNLQSQGFATFEDARDYGIGGRTLEGWWVRAEMMMMMTTTTMVVLVALAMRRR